MQRFIFITVIAVLIALGAMGQDYPQAPSGYNWEACEDIGGALLRPEAWSFRRVADGDSLGYFVTKRPLEPPQSFDVGLTLNVLFGMPEKTGRSPSNFAKAFVAEAAKSASVERTWSSDGGPFLSEGIVYLGSGETEGYKFFNLIIANDKTGTAYLVIFEAPEASWDAEWTVIEPTIQQLGLDDEY